MMKIPFFSLSMLFFLLSLIICQATPFITTWKTDNSGTSGSTEITIPGTGSYTIDWEEVANPSHKGSTLAFGPITLDFSIAGTYEISIPDGMTQIQFNFGGDRLKLLTIEQWGTLEWAEMNGAFLGCTNLTYHAVDAPDLSRVTDMTGMFSNCPNFNGAIGGWDVSHVNYMGDLFYGCSTFNQDISGWNVSNVTYMSAMFNGCSVFNQNLSGWDVSASYNMSNMFGDCANFNQDISGWNVTNVNDMSLMFHGSIAFNQYIGGWNVSNVSNMYSMFSGATNFNQDIGGWNVSSVNDISFMFYDAAAFDQNLGDWDLTNVWDMFAMLSYSGLSTESYDNTLIGWDAQGLSNKFLLATGLTYCNGETARNALIANGWFIDGDSKDCTLPVEWISFEAINSGDRVRLDWSTASERNNEHYDIESSTDQDNWREIGTVKADGSSSQPRDYSFLDTRPTTGRNFYRLKQVDVNGSFSYSSQVEVLISASPLRAYPNPFHDVLQLEISNADWTGGLYDAQGRQVKVWKNLSGNTTLTTGNLPVGTYLLRLSAALGEQKQIIIVKR